jgi:hypothetical protein
MARSSKGFDCVQPNCGKGYLHADHELKISREGDAIVIEHAETSD